MKFRTIKWKPNILENAVIQAAGLLVAVLITLGLANGSAHAQTALSLETTVTLGGVARPDESVPFLGVPGLQVNLGDLSGASAVAAVSQDTSGTTYFVLESTTRLPGGLVVEPRDVVQFDGDAYTLAFDGEDEGVPRGARIDAMSGAFPFLLSFDTTVRLPGGVVVADEDLVEWREAGFLSPLYFDGSLADVPIELDLDAVHAVTPNLIQVSFATSGRLGSTRFSDEDVLEYDRSANTWSIFLDLSESESTTAQTDLDAFVNVPEPGVAMGLVLGLLSLSGRARSRFA